MSQRLKALLLALAVSVALNLFFVGFYVARMANRPHLGRLVGPLGGGGERGAVLHEMWKERAETLRGKREAIETARRGVRAALVAELFDPQVLVAALAALRAETNDTQAALDQALVDFARGLSVEDRKKLADARWFGNLGDRRGPRGH